MPLKDFLAIYKTTSLWNRVIFRADPTKKKLIAERRAALKAEDDTRYAELNLNIAEYD